MKNKKCKHKWIYVSGFYSEFKGYGYMATLLCHKCKKHKIVEYKEIKE